MMRFLVYDRLNVQETIVPWCEENFGIGSQTWQWFPYYQIFEGDSAIMFRIDNDEDALMFKIVWGKYIAQSILW